MKKYAKYALIAAAALTAVTGCSKQMSEETKAAGETAAETSAETEATVEALKTEPVDPGKIVKLGEYMGLELTKDSVEVTEEELDAKIQSIMDANPEYVEQDRPAKLGDIVNIDFVGKMDGEEFNGGTSKGYKLELGSHSFIEGFEDGLVGTKAGDKKDLDLTFPENYHSEELAGKPVVFEVTVNSVIEMHDAVLDDAFVQRVSDFKTVDEFKADTLADLEKQKEEMAERNLQDAALKIVFDASEFEVNPEAVDQLFNRQLDYMKNQVAMFGMTMEDYAGMYGMTAEEFEELLRGQSETAVKQQILFDAIAEAENLEVTDEDRQRVADMYGTTVEELQKISAENLDSEARTYKTIDYVIENAVVK